MTIGLNKKKQKRNRKFYLPWYTVVSYGLLWLHDPGLLGTVTLLSALLHEVGHVGMAFALGIPVAGITLYPFGADIRLGYGLRSYRKDLAVAAAGAGVNLVLLLLGLALGGRVGMCLTAANLVLGSMNLLPIEGLDGGAVCLALLGLVCDGKRQASVLRTVSFFGLFVLWVIAVYVLLVTDGDPSLLVIVCALFASVFLRDDGDGRFRGKWE